MGAERVHVAVLVGLQGDRRIVIQYIIFPSVRPSAPSTVFSMSRAANILEQDVGGGEGDNLPTYENLAEAHGPNSRYGYSSI
jgi:hypothetical protein